MKNSEYFTKPVAVEINNSKGVEKARVRNYWTILILLMIFLLLFLMLKVVWYAPKLTATLGVKDENPDYIDGEINITINPEEWTNGDVLVTVDYKSDKEEVQNLISIDGGETFVEYTEPIKVAKNTKIVARIVENEPTADSVGANISVRETGNNNMSNETVGVGVPDDPHKTDYNEIIAEKTQEIQNIDKLAPKDFNIAGEQISQRITINAKTEDEEATLESGKSEIKEYEYVIRKGDWTQSKTTKENTCTFDKLEQGETYKIVVYAIDNAGNEKKSNEIEVKVKASSRLTINPNGGKWEEKEGKQEIYQEPGSTKEISEPTKIGYTFKKWTLTNGGKLEKNTYTYGEIDGTITAEWEINEYTLTFDPNGGNITQNTITNKYNERITMPVPTKESHAVSFNAGNDSSVDPQTQTVSDTFIGWYTELSAGEKREYTAIPALNETLYAHWNKAKITLPKPTKTGYTLVGWYEDENYTKIAGNAEGEYIVEKDITLYAKWEINKYTLNFNANGGEVTPNIITQDYDTDITLPTPIREYEIEYNANGGNKPTNEYVDYTFTGWYTELSAGEKREYTKIPAINETLYAHWDNTNANITLPDTTRAGYTFEGWYEDSALTKKAGNTGDNYTPTSNITLYAKWKAEEYTLTFDANGGNLTQNTITQEYETNITLPVPTKQYTVTYETNGGNTLPNTISTYNFLGWYTEATNGDERKYTKMPAINETLYAHWDNANAEITLPTPTKIGHTFQGWYSDNTLSTKIGNAGDTFIPTGDTTIYAAWEVQEYTLTLDPNGGKLTQNTITQNFGEAITMPTPTKQCTITYETNGGNTLPNTISTYNFLGWYTELSAGEQRNYTNMPALDETLYAHWSDKAQSITLPMPIKAGYTFGGWYSDSALSQKIGEAGKDYTPTGDITIYAKWNVNAHTLTFDPNGAITIYAGFAPSIYAKLYTDGTLAFTATDKNLSGKTLSKDYGLIGGKTGGSIDNDNKTNVTTVDVVDKIQPIYTNDWFSGCSNLTTINNISNLDTSNVTNMSCMFSGCSSLTQLDLNTLDTSSVTYMTAMFYGCSSLTELDLSNFDTSKATTLSQMFYGCSSLTSLDLSSFNTSNVTDIFYMFRGCSSLTSLDLSSFDTSNVTNMYGMFQDCSSLTSLDVSGFDTSNVKSMGDMFYGCNSLTELDLSNFDTSNVTAMNGMFEKCSSLTSLDLSSFDTSNVTNMKCMFSGCSKLITIYVGANWQLASNTTDMYKDCTARPQKK